MNRTLVAALALVLAAPAAVLAAEAEQKPKAEAKKSREIYAVFVTSRGKIAARLLPDETPKAVANFVELATGKKEWTVPVVPGRQADSPEARNAGKATKERLYDGTLFHRVIPGFMIQGGDPASRNAPPLSGPPVQADTRFGVYGPGFRFDDELQAGARPFDQPCQLAMANSGPNTNGSQFFITEVPVAHLNPKPCSSKSGVCGYVRFGVGVCGCERVKPIAAAGGSQTRLEKILIVHEKPSCN